MMKPRKQVRNLLILIALLMGLVGSAMAETPSKTEEKAGAAGAGGDKTYSVGQVVTGITEAVSDVVSPSTDKKPAEAAALIKAKRLDNGEPKKDAAAPAKQAAPYKVYNAPMIAEEEPDSPPSSAFAGWDKKPPRTIDPTKPPPLTDTMLYEGRDIQPPPQTAKSTTKNKGVPPISALPKQFFPILPYGARGDTAMQLLPVASNVDLEADHSDTTRAIIFIHDISRNAAEGIATLMTLAGSNGDEAMILAPQFPLEVDVMRFAQHLPDSGRNIARWPLERGWQEGGESLLPQQRKGISSFTAIDLLMMFLSDRRRFPMLQQIIVAGHGVGGDFVQRYAAIGEAPDIVAKEKITVRFVVANPSSYMYLTGIRPSETGPSFTHPDTKDCPLLDAYPYGLNDPIPYAKRTGANAIRLRYPERKVLYLVGDKIISDNYLDRSCAAAAQGKDRTARGRNFARYLMQSYGEDSRATQTFTIVPNAGYDPVSLFGSYCGMSILFGDGVCPTK